MNKQRQHRRVWTQHEDDTLRQYVEQSADISKPKWKQISQLLNGELNLEFKRNPKQCRERWYNSLAPTSQQTKVWGVHDDVTLIQACKKYGHRWSRLTKQFDQSVNDNRLKNHFYSTVRKIVRVINAIVKECKRQYQRNVKNNNLHIYPHQQLEKMKQISKLRTFQPKLLSKVFSLIDEKQEYRYEAKQSLEVEQLRSINHEILDYMEDYVTSRNQFDNPRILAMIIKVMHINRTIKTKYVREVKLSIQDEDEVQKQQQNRKKRQKKINHIVKQELDNKIIPDRRTKIQIINKIRDDNKKLNKLIKNDKRKIKRKPHHQQTSVMSKKGEDERGNQMADEGDVMNLNESLEFQNKSSLSKERSNKTAKQEKDQQKKYEDKFDQQEYDQVGSMLNLNFANQIDQYNIRNSNSFNYSIGRDKLPSHYFNSNQNNQAYPAFNNILSYSFDDLNQKNGGIESRKEKSKEQMQSEQRSCKSNNKPPLIVQNRKKETQPKDHPFVSNFLNDIPLLTSKASIKNEKPQIMQAINPFFPEHKLTHSQGYFSFDKPLVGKPEPQDNDLFRSNPNIASISFIEIQNQNAEPEEKKSLKNSKNFQGLFASHNYSSNNDLMSQQSERMKSSLFDLIPNFHPMHTSAFCPILFGISKDNQNDGRENRQLEISKPLSAFLQDNMGQRFNIEQSQPMAMYRSSDLQGDSNPSGSGLYHSYSFGQLSQQNKSNHSKIRK